MKPSILKKLNSWTIIVWNYNILQNHCNCQLSVWTGVFMGFRIGSSPRNVGFISTRIAGTDGVSLEIEKWASVLERNDFECFYFSGDNDRPRQRCETEEFAHFLNPEILEVHKQCFEGRTRPREITRKIHLLKDPWN